MCANWLVCWADSMAMPKNYNMHCQDMLVTLQAASARILQLLTVCQLGSATRQLKEKVQEPMQKPDTLYSHCLCLPSPHCCAQPANGTVTAAVAQEVSDDIALILSMHYFCRPCMQGIAVPRTLAASDPFAIAVLSCTHTYLEHTA